MGIQVLYRRPNTSKPAPAHKIYPALLRKRAATRPNQVWAADIAYIPLLSYDFRSSRCIMGAALDRFSRKVLAWRLSVTLETTRCPEALNAATRRFGPPEVMNTDSHTMVTSSRAV